MSNAKPELQPVNLERLANAIFELKYWVSSHQINVRETSLFQDEDAAESEWRKIRECVVRIQALLPTNIELADIDDALVRRNLRKLESLMLEFTESYALDGDSGRIEYPLLDSDVARIGISWEEFADFMTIHRSDSRSKIVAETTRLERLDCPEDSTPVEKENTGHSDEKTIDDPQETNPNECANDWRKGLSLDDKGWYTAGAPPDNWPEPIEGEKRYIAEVTNSCDPSTLDAKLLSDDGYFGLKVHRTHFKLWFHPVLKRTQYEDALKRIEAAQDSNRD